MAVSPVAAPFGSVEFAEHLPDPVLSRFLHKLVEIARSLGLNALRLVNYPHHYAPVQAERLTRQLRQNGFRLTHAYQNHALRIGSDAFIQTIHASERRRLRKCHRAGFVTQQWLMPDIGAVIRFIAETRQQQGYQLTIEPERLAGLLRQFPGDFPVFAVHDGSALAALTVAVRVRADILYNFLPASSPASRTFSPAVLLTECLYVYCQQHSIRLLDLGVSLDNDRQFKPTLARFKERLGATPSEKLVFERVF